MKYNSDCDSCNNKILHDDVIVSSNETFGVSLCKTCQFRYKDGLQKSAFYANRLFFALRRRNIHAKLGHYDGYKTIDIYVEESKLYIEVDGDQHNTDSKQALSDLKRTYWACKEGYFTLRIPNSLVKKNIRESIKFIIHIIDLLKEQNQGRAFRRA